MRNQLDPPEADKVLLGSSHLPSAKGCSWMRLSNLLFPTPASRSLNPYRKLGPAQPPVPRGPGSGLSPWHGKSLGVVGKTQTQRWQPPARCPAWPWLPAWHCRGHGVSAGTGMCHHWLQTRAHLGVADAVLGSCRCSRGAPPFPGMLSLCPTCAWRC